MFSKEVINNVKAYTKKFYEEDRLNESIDAFQKLIWIDNATDIVNFTSKYSEKIVNLFYPIPNFAAWEDKEGCKIEEFLKKLLILTDHNEWVTKTRWELNDLYNYFGFFRNINNVSNEIILKARIEDRNNESGFRITAADPNKYKECPGYIGHYIRAYQYRNSISHGSVISDIYEKMDNIISLIIVYLDMSYKYKDKISDIYAMQSMKKAADGRSICNQIINTNMERKRPDKYVELLWTETEPNLQRSNMELNNKKTILEVYHEENRRLTKLIGEPGIGKSETLNYLQYCLAKAYLSDTNKEIPILLNLIEFTEEDTIVDKAADILNVAKSDMENFMTQGKIALFLDAFNEVQDDELRRKLALEIRSLIENYTRVRFVFTDRTERNSPPYANEAKCFYLCPLTKEDIILFFKKNCSDISIQSEILRRLDDPTGLGWLVKKSTPFILVNIRDMAVDYDTYPSEEEFFEKYIDSLFKREEDNKCDYNIPLLKRCLQDVACEHGGDTLTRRAIEKIFTGDNYSRMDENRARKLVQLAVEDMKILEKKDDNQYGFTRDEYFNYFLLLDF